MIIFAIIVYAAITSTFADFPSEVIALSAISGLAIAGMFTLFAFGGTIAISSSLLRNPRTHAKILKLLNVLSLIFLLAIVVLLVSFVMNDYFDMPPIVGTVLAFILMRIHIRAGWGLVHLTIRHADS
jgi:ABC-type transport system involved in cytochrome c biogenesis permease subunit